MIHRVHPVRINKQLCKQTGLIAMAMCLELQKSEHTQHRHVRSCIVIAYSSIAKVKLFYTALTWSHNTNGLSSLRALSEHPYSHQNMCAFCLTSTKPWSWSGILSLSTGKISNEDKQKRTIAKIQRRLLIFAIEWFFLIIKGVACVGVF